MKLFKCSLKTYFYAKIFPVEYCGLFQGRLYFTSSDKVVFEKSMSVLSILLGYQLKRKRRKRGVLKNRCEIFRDDNDQSLYKNIKLYNDIGWNNPGPVYVNESTEYCHLQGVLSHKKKLLLHVLRAYV